MIHNIVKKFLNITTYLTSSAFFTILIVYSYPTYFNTIESFSEYEEAQLTKINMSYLTTLEGDLSKLKEEPVKTLKTIIKENSATLASSGTSTILGSLGVAALGTAIGIPIFLVPPAITLYTDYQCRERIQPLLKSTFKHKAINAHQQTAKPNWKILLLFIMIFGIISMLNTRLKINKKGT